MVEMAMSPDEKGRELERAVQAIEAIILASSPGLSKQPFKIESRKRVKVAGVHHEIDILVSVEAAKGYTSTFIFECKNWEEAVGKNDIIVFSEKIKAICAQGGFFVAKSFTKDAAAQAASDPRLILLDATEHDPASTVTPECFHITTPATANPSTTFRVAGTSGKNVKPIDAKGKNFRLRGQEMPLIKYLDGWMHELYQEKLLYFRTAHLSEGVHPMVASAERSFNGGEFVLDGQQIEHVRMDVEFGVQIIRPAVISNYEVATRGRAIRLEKVQIRDLAIETTFVMAAKDED